VKIVQLGLAAMLLSGATLVHAVPSYTITAIGPSGSYAQDINNAGTVVGYSGAQSGFIYDHGSYTTHSVPGAESTSFGSISNNGVVLGGASLPAGSGYALRYANGNFTVYAPPAGYNIVQLRAINNAGVMVGRYGGATSSAFSDNGSGPQFLTPPGINSYAHDINNSGTIVGDVLTSGTSHAVVYDNSSSGYSLVGSFANSSSASAINDSGWIGGSYSISALLSGAFLRDGQGNMTLYSLPNREMFLNDINNSGMAVGTGWASSSPDSWAYLFTDNGAVDLNTRVLNGSDWTIVAASGINDSGSISGTGCHQSTGVCQAVLLEVSPVPEPGAWAMLLAGLATVGAGSYRARRRRGA
jgi:hypothetical protein